MSNVNPLRIFGYIMLFIFLTFIFASIRVSGERATGGTVTRAPITTTYKNVQCYIVMPDLICPNQAPTGPR